MNAYIYCSYKFSPVGFRIGKITYNPSETSDYIPTNKGIDKFIATAFEQGFISKVYGLNPNNKKYVYLVRNLRKTGIEDAQEGEIDVYMNLAFEFDSYDEYKNFAVNFDVMSIEEAADECIAFIAPDRLVEDFALKIRATEFNLFVEKMSAFSDNVRDSDDGKIYIEVISTKTQDEKLQSVFNLNFENVGEKKYCYPANEKKKRRIRIFSLQ